MPRLQHPNSPRCNARHCWNNIVDSCLVSALSAFATGKMFLPRERNLENFGSPESRKPCIRAWKRSLCAFAFRTQFKTGLCLMKKILGFRTPHPILDRRLELEKGLAFTLHAIGWKSCKSCPISLIAERCLVVLPASPAWQGQIQHLGLGGWGLHTPKPEVFCPGSLASTPQKRRRSSIFFKDGDTQMLALRDFFSLTCPQSCCVGQKVQIQDLGGGGVQNPMSEVSHQRSQQILISVWAEVRRWGSRPQLRFTLVAANLMAKKGMFRPRIPAKKERQRHTQTPEVLLWNPNSEQLCHPVLLNLAFQPGCCSTPGHL